MTKNKIEMLLFTSPYCGPCKTLKGIISGMELPIPVRTVDSAGEESERYNITHVPTLLILNDKEVVKRHTGLMTEKQLVKFCTII